MANGAVAGVMVGALMTTAVLYNGVFIGVARVCAPFARVAIKKAVFGFGPRLFRAGFDVGTLEVSLIPLTAYVQFAGANPYVEDEPPAPPRLLWHDAPPARRALGFFVVPRLVALVVVVALLGPHRGAASILAGFTDALAAFTGGAPALFDRAARVFAEEGFVTLVGLVLAKGAAFQLAQTPEGVALLWRGKSAKGIAKARAALMLVWLAFVVAWLVAFGRWAIA